MKQAKAIIRQLTYDSVAKLFGLLFKRSKFGKRLLTKIPEHPWITQFRWLRLPAPGLVRLPPALDTPES